MAEVVALAASIIAVVQIADRIATVSKWFIETVHDYPRDLRLVHIETGSLKVIFESLGFLNQDDPADSAVLQKLRGPDGPVEGCKNAMEQLDKLMPSLPLPTSKQKGAKRVRIQTALTNLAWPLKAETARKLLDEIMLHKSTINVALQGQLLTEFRSMKEELGEVHVTLNDSEKRKVYDWYQDTNPSSSHNAARGLYEDKTGDWVFETPEWDAWINTQVRALWIHGIPGAGKTILAAYIIKKTFELCETSPKRTVCVYYYCYHGHNQDESVPFLRWLLSQLLREVNTVPAIAWKAYSKTLEPNTTLLLDILDAILESFDTVFVVIDALDESQHRHNLLGVIQELVTNPRFRKVQLLATSREYSDIELTMHSFSQSLSMANPFVEKDIRVYVEAKIRANPKFQKWPPDLQSDVEEALSAGAKGMFRWTVCQLDILRRLDHQSKIRQALKCLPKTLDETYERIFSYITEEEKEFVRFSLHWICMHSRIWTDVMPLYAQLLVDAYVASNNAEGRSISDEYLFDLDTLKESCGCLISFTFEQNEQSASVNIAHYTVREFLESDRSSYVSWFKIDQDASYRSILAFILEYAITSEYGDIEREAPETSSPADLRSISGLQYYCLASSVVSISHEKLTEPSLAFRFLDPLEPHYDSLRKALRLYDNLYCRNAWRTNVGFGHVYWHESTKNSKINILADLLLMRRYDLAKVYGRGLDIQKTLQSSLFGQLHEDFMSEDPSLFDQFGCNLVELVAELKKLDENALDFFELEFNGLVDYANLLPHYMGGLSRISEIDLMRDNSGVVARLIKLGASPNPRGFQVTPLQIAVCNRDIPGVRALLQAGADPHDTGDEQGVRWVAGKSILSHYCHLHRHTPLFILHHIRGNYSYYAGINHRKAIEMERLLTCQIESLLLDYGASVDV